MIYIRLAGGLGNQLFQLAAGFEIQHKTNLPISLYAKALSTYRTKRDPMILDFITTEGMVNLCKPSWKTTLLEKRLGKLNLPVVFPFSINNHTISHSKSTLNFYLVDDYFQDTSKIANGLRKVKTLIKLKAENDNKINEILSGILKNTNQDQLAALHIRRGDYSSDQYKSIYPTLEESYYKNAVKELDPQINKLIIFSDDPNISFDFFKDFEIFKVSSLHLNDIQELLLMSMFQNIIIANSTFSFWGAISNDRMKKNKIAPKCWTSKNTENRIWQQNLISESFIIE